MFGMEEVWAFLLLVIGVSLSGVMAPGALTAATIAEGSRGAHGGVWVALGHGMVEFPLIGVLALGAGQLFKLSGVKIGVGLIGGMVLILLGMQLFGMVRRGVGVEANGGGRGPVLTGVLLTAGNPYFLLWWATIGLGLIGAAQAFGWWMLVLFAVVHWLCDLVWLEILSAGSFGGGKVFGDRVQMAMVEICAVALFGFGVWFIADAGGMLAVG